MRKKKLIRWSRFLIAFLLSLLICFVAGATLILNKQQLEQVQMERLVLTKSNKLSEVLSKLLYKTQTLAVLVMQNNGSIQDFEKLAATIVDDPAIKNILIAPDGVVSDVYPLEGNEQVIGLDYFSEGEGNAEAMQAKETGQLILGGPFRLVQGGQALVGRLPVYMGEEGNKEFWGIVSVTLHYPQALEGAELSSLEDQGFSYELWRISPDTQERQTIASNSYEYGKKVRYVERPIQIFNAEWYFRIAPIREWYQYMEAWVYIFVGLLVSFLFGFLCLHNYDLNRMREELEGLSEKDALTGVLNRRGLFRLLEELTQDTLHPFLLCYLDLDKFKDVNDRYGHNTGDKVLQSFVHILQKYVGDNGEIARIGGDEFVLVFREAAGREEADPFFREMKEALQKPLTVGRNHHISVSFSAGTAHYPEDGRSMDELVAAADNAMYTSKRSYGEDR